MRKAGRNRIKFSTAVTVCEHDSRRDRVIIVENYRESQIFWSHE